MILFEARASIILYNVLKSLNTKKIFLLPLNICPIVPAIFLKAEVSFQLVDISNESLCIDEERLYTLIEDKASYGGILFLKTFGINFNAEKIYKKLRQINNDLFIIEDQCLSIPIIDFKINSTEANLVLFSTGYSKYVDLAWGGFGFMDNKFKYISSNLPFDEECLDDLIKQFQLSIENKMPLIYENTNWLGSNQILHKNFFNYSNTIKDEISKITKHKTNLNNIYTANLPQEIILGSNYNNWRFNIMVSNKEALLKKIFQHNLFASSHYSSLEYIYKYTKEKQNSNASKLHNNIINLFNDFRFKENEALELTDIINNFYKGNQT
ncbi:hypothetical protein [Poseidonibacter sp.]|uniref:hypothetical protein n=1 Tax=Poseidonibacter sp. TaxID=2321188 RepID=UPI003C727FF1